MNLSGSFPDQPAASTSAARGCRRGAGPAIRPRSSIQSPIPNPQSAIPYSLFPIPCRRGITLIELLVVIALFTTILAISAGAYLMSSRRYREQGAAAQIEVTIRQARNDALFSGAPSFVEFDTSRPAPRPPRIVPWGYRVSGMWHFEEGTSKEAAGGRGNRAFVNNCSSADGKIGRAVATGWVRSGQGVRGYVECLPNPDFDCENGGYLEAYVFLEFETTQQQYVFHKPDCYALFVNGDGYLCGRVGRTTVDGQNFVIPLRRWTKVAMAFDKNSIRLLVDDSIVQVAQGEETPVRTNPLFIGDPGAPILGRIDEAKVLTAVRGSAFELPPGAQLTHNAAPWNAAFFSADGQLDLRYHPGTITVNMTLDRKVHPIYVNMLGFTRRGEIERAKTTEEVAAEEAKKTVTQPPRTIAPIRVPPVKIPVLPPKPATPPAQEKPAGKPTDTPAEKPATKPANAPAGTSPEGGTP